MPLYARDLKDVLLAAWGEELTTEQKRLLPVPQIVDVMGEGQTLRQDILNKGDLLTIVVDGIDEQPIANYIFLNEYIDFSIDIHTRVSRQRLYDLINETRRIIHRYKHSFPNIQRMTFQSVVEGVSDSFGIYVARVALVGENNCKFANV